MTVESTVLTFWNQIVGLFIECKLSKLNLVFGFVLNFRAVSVEVARDYRACIRTHVADRLKRMRLN